jgi:molybdopterin synthase sulfur carrier subunit
MSTSTALGQFNILYFAAASSYTKKMSESLPAPLPANQIFDVLDSRYPGIKEKILTSCAVTLNLEYIDVDVDELSDPSISSIIIREGDEVAIIPPVSSG